MAFADEFDGGSAPNQSSSKISDRRKAPPWRASSST
jgi:hypothetical protein